jgi:hypothetical protein
MKKANLMAGAVVAAILVAGAPVAARSVVDFARNAARLGGEQPEAFVHKCAKGGMAGVASMRHSPAEYETLPGYAFVPEFREGCKRQEVTGRMAEEGVYLIRFGDLGCSDEPAPPAQLVVTVAESESPLPLIPSYSTVCDDGVYAQRVVLRDPQGVRHAAPFTAALFELP